MTITISIQIRIFIHFFFISLFILYGCPKKIIPSTNVNSTLTRAWVEPGSSEIPWKSVCKPLDWDHLNKSINSVSQICSEIIKCESTFSKLNLPRKLSGDITVGEWLILAKVKVPVAAVYWKNQTTEPMELLDGIN